MQVLFWIPYQDLINLSNLQHNWPDYNAEPIDWSKEQHHPTWIQVALSVDDFIKFTELKILNHYGFHGT